jgi:hypothetical protein
MYHPKNAKSLKRESTPFCALASLALLLLPSPSRAEISFDLSSIARTGDPAPVPPELRQFGDSSINDSGQVAFEADNAVFLRSNGATTIIGALGDPAPDGGAFLASRMPSLNARGQVAFAAEVASSGREGVFLWSEGNVRPIAQFADAAPGGGTFVAFYELALQAAGESVAFSGYTTLSQEDLFLFSQGAIRLLARGGDPAPGGGTFRSFFFPAINIHEQVVFYSDLSPSGSGVFLAQQDGTITAVARTGDPAPAGGTFDFSKAPAPAIQHLAITGDPARLRRESTPRQSLGDGGATFRYFGFPRGSINDSGEVAFSAGTSILGRGGIFVFSKGQITRRIRERSPAPGGGEFTFMDSPSFNAAGQIAFGANISTPPGRGMFLASADGSIIQVARVLEPSPEGDIFTGVFTPSLNAAGAVAFLGQLLNRTGGIYLFSKGTITRVAGHGDPIDREPRFIDASPGGIDRAGEVVFSARMFPGGSALLVGAPSTLIATAGDPAPEGGVFTYVYQHAVSDNGQIVFVGFTTRSVGLYSPIDGVLRRIAAAGDPAPGGGAFTNFSSPSINNNGDVAFLGYVVSPSTPGLFGLSGRQFRQFVAFGGPAPGGGTFGSLNYTSFNDAGQLAFSALVTAPGRSGIFRASEGSVEGIAQTGDSAPGGGTFNFTSLSFRHRASLNASGQVAFGGPMSTGFTGVFLSTDGVLSSIARPGDPVPGAGTIVFADSASLNDSGQVAFPAATTAGGTAACLVSEGILSKIAGAGDPAPGGGTFTYATLPKLNSHAQVAFAGGVTGGFGAYVATPAR